MAALAWRKIDPRDPHNDQRADLLAGHWAEIGPNGWEGWDWTILRAELPTCDQLTVADGTATTEADAKMYVEAWQASYHPNAVRITPHSGGFWRWRVTCRECRLWRTAYNLRGAYRIAAEHADTGSCQDLWREHLVGVR